MKILFIAPRFHTNQFHTLKNLLKKNRVYLHCIKKGSVENYTDIVPVIIKRNNSYKILKYFPSFSFYYNFFKHKKIDLIIIRFFNRPFFYFFICLGKIFKCRIIIYEQTPKLFYRNTNIKNILRNLEKKFIFCFFSKLWYSTILSSETRNLRQIPFAVEARKKIITIKKNLKILSIGKFQERKDHFLLIKTVKELLSEKYALTLTIIGQVSDLKSKLIFNKINHYVKSNNLTNKIIIKKNISHEKIKNYFFNCNLFILPSYNEPGSISVLEAQGFSRPVICSDTCGTKIYINKNCGKIFQSHNKQSLKKSIIFFLNRKNMFTYFFQKSYNNCIKNFTGQKYIEKLYKLMKHD